MIPYTTPVFLVTGLDPRLLEDTVKLRADIVQNDILLQKWLAPGHEGEITADFESGSISVYLSQEESGQFKEGELSLQIHGLMEDGTTAWKTYVMSVRVHKSLTEEVIS